MKAIRRVILVLVLLALALSLTSGAYAGPGPVAVPLPVASGSGLEPLADAVPATVTHNINFQGRLTAADGTPMPDADYNVTFKLYNMAVVGGAMATDTNAVHVANGVFSTSLDFGGALAQFNGQELYVGVTLEGNPEMTPRITVRPVPYALSLRPGARMEGVATGSGPGTAILSVTNITVGSNRAAIHGLSGPDVAEAPNKESGIFGESSAGYGVSGFSVDGYGVVGYSRNGYAVYAASANGPGLFAYGGGGNAAIAVAGKITSTAKSYIWVSGNSFVKALSDDTTRWSCASNGAVAIYRGSAPAGKLVYYPITLPAVLYGQPVRLTSLTISYKCENGANSYIGLIRLNKQTDADSQVIIATDSTEHRSNTAVDHTIPLTSNNVLSAGDGALGLHVSLQFANDTDYVQIGGIRLEIEHD